MVDPPSNASAATQSERSRLLRRVSSSRMARLLQAAGQATAAFGLARSLSSPMIRPKHKIRPTCQGDTSRELLRRSPARVKRGLHRQVFATPTTVLLTPIRSTSARQGGIR